MPFQPPSIMAACMILLAAPKLAACMPTNDATHVLRQADEDPMPIQQINLEPEPSPTPQAQTPPVVTPSGSTTPVIVPETGPYYAVQGCYEEPKKGRALDHVATDPAMTVELCGEIAASYAYFGLQYGSECWYGNTLRKGSHQVDDDACSMPCAGDPSQTCGNGRKLNLWRRSDAYIPVDKEKIGEYDLQGCYVDTLNPRALRRVLGDDNMTPDMCVEFCAGSTYMGLEYGRECWCDDVLDITSFKATLDDCQMPCAGDLSAMCGSPNRMDLYKLNSPAPPDADYYTMGCYYDIGAHHRALPELYADDNMTPQLCAGFAARRGFKHFGVEYGRECWAGPQIDPAAFPTDGCDMPCAGNDEVMCGGRTRFNLYTYDANDVVQQSETYSEEK
ncbi:WSC domain-containing protein [Stachybotrys elegans]|uniref:WSC domain-containing protein n=1 Tax=Stachybotrys elegans TaxID=80388 RepID=A0A8K0SGR6_9HYPO|nr:WSC domain-containing protein [Stachybotrys elegans]